MLFFTYAYFRPSRATKNHLIQIMRSEQWFQPAFIGGTATLLLTSLCLQAQQKPDLTFEQVFKGQATHITNPLPAIREWTDGEHYLEMRPDPVNGRMQAWNVDARSGKATVYTAPVDGPSVEVREKDIFYKAADGQVTRLTNDSAEEKIRLFLPMESMLPLPATTICTVWK